MTPIQCLSSTFVAWNACGSWGARLAGLLLLASASGCAGDAHVRPAGAIAPRPAPISHLVFAKLKDPGDADLLIADCDAMLGALPMVVSYACGSHLDTGRGSQIDSDYDVGMYIGFETIDDYAVYMEHPQHVELVTKWRPRMEWLRIQDVADWSP